MTNIEELPYYRPTGIIWLGYLSFEAFNQTYHRQTTSRRLIVTMVWHKTTFFLEEQALALHRFTVRCIGNQSKFKWHARNRPKTMKNYYATPQALVLICLFFSGKLILRYKNKYNTYFIIIFTKSLLNILRQVPMMPHLVWRYKI